MKHWLHWVLLVFAVLAIASGGAGWARTDQDQPEVSGTTQGNTGCAILEKHTPVKGKLLALGVIYARTEYKVIDSFNYTMPKSKFTIGLIRAISVNYFSGEPVTRSEAREVAANWEPWRTVATWYMWRSLDPLPVDY